MKLRGTLLPFGDICILYVSLILTLVFRYGNAWEDHFVAHILPFSIIFAFWTILLYITHLYDISLAQNTLRFFTNFTYAIVINAGFAFLLFYFVPFFGITPKTNLFVFLITAAILEAVWRYGFNRLIIQSGLRYNTLIIGVGQQAEELYYFLKENPQLGYDMLGLVPLEQITEAENLEKLITEKDIRILVLNPDVYQIPRIIDILYKLRALKVDIRNLSNFYELVSGKVPLGSIDQAWFLRNFTETAKIGYEITKRFFDFFFAFISGAVSLVLYPFIILAIRLDSSGPIFYRQKRVGREGKIFTVIKFRTMVQDAEKNGPQWASANDTRITPMGKFLRKSRLDELPQLWNVLRGEMSFVGPRPERPEFHEKLKQEVPFYEERYLSRPGLTGWAQIKYKLDFKGGMTVQDTLEKVQYDLYYIKNRSLLLDLGIILKTGYILFQRVVAKV